MAKITIIGAGSWGLALATVLSSNQHQTMLWTKDCDDLHQITETHKSKYTYDLLLPEELKITNDLDEALAFSKIIVLVIPVKAIPEVLKQMSLNDSKIFVIASKGLYQGKTVSNIIQNTIPQENLDAIVALSGPSFAKHVLYKKPTAIVSASKSLKAAKHIQKIFNNNYFRVYTSKDIEGVLFCGAIKNVIAVGAGIIAGAGYEANARAALITRSLHEMNRIAKTLAIKSETLYGLTGIGDLILTATDITSRNYHVGYLIGQGRTLAEAIEIVQTTTEGINTLNEMYQLKSQYQIEMPIIEAIYNVVINGHSIDKELSIIMKRSLKDEGTF